MENMCRPYRTFVYCAYKIILGGSIQPQCKLSHTHTTGLDKSTKPQPHILVVKGCVLHNMLERPVWCWVLSSVFTSLPQTEPGVSSGSTIHWKPLTASRGALQSEGVCPGHLHSTLEGVHPLRGHSAAALRPSAALPEGLLATTTTGWLCLNAYDTVVLVLTQYPDLSYFYSVF